MADIFNANQTSTKPPVKKVYRPLAAFCYYPAHANFENKDNDETVVLLLRRHPITNLRWIFIGTLMIIAPFVVSIFPIFSSIPANFYLVGVLAWYLITLAFIFENFLIWYFNIIIFTDERVLDVDFVNLIYRQISDTEFDEIQDVTVSQGGVIRTIFNYGDILIQTAAEQQEFEVQAIPFPDQAAKILRDLREGKERQEK